MKHVEIFTDGACRGNPGPGGWGALMRFQGKEREIWGGELETTNNQMELAGAIFALKEISKLPGPVTFYTDSTYVIRGITQWIWGWRKKGWKTAEGADVMNRDQWEELSRLVGERGAANKVNWLYSRGHVGTPGNERCDEIAVAFSQKESIRLYDGPLSAYSIDIMKLPAIEPWPEMKPKGEKVAAFSYLSLLGATVIRHKTWPSCERRVKGQPGAKFKKAKSADDEKEILKGWGLSSQTSITNDPT